MEKGRKMKITRLMPRLGYISPPFVNMPMAVAVAVAVVGEYPVKWEVFNVA